MAKMLSRPKRWAVAVAELSKAKSNLETAAEEYNNALSELRDIQSEYEEAKDNTPDNLQSTPYYEKLEAICDLSLDDLELELDIVDEVESVDLPLGFGRD